MEQAKNRSLYHWLVVAACCGICGAAIGITSNCMGVFFTPVAGTLNTGRGSVALFSTIVGLIQGFGSPVVARLMTRYKLRLIVSVGVLLDGGGILLLSTVKSVWMIYLLAVVVGCGAALISTTVVMTVLGNWFQEKYGLASGISVAAASLLSAAFTPALSAIIESSGWRTAYVAAGGVAIAMALPGALFVLRIHPKEKGYLPYGGTVRPVAPDAQPKSAPKTRLTGKEMASIPFIGCCFAGFCAAGIYSASAHYPGYALELGLGSASGALMITCCMVGNLLSKILVGILSDTIGTVKACSLMYLTTVGALTALMLAPADNRIVALGAAFFTGFICCMGNVGVSLVTRYVFGVERFQSVFAYVAIFPCLGTAVMTPIYGYMYDFTRSYRAAMGVALGLAILGFVFMILACRTRKKVDRRL